MRWPALRHQSPEAQSRNEKSDCSVLSPLTPASSFQRDRLAAVGICDILESLLLQQLDERRSLIGLAMHEPRLADLASKRAEEFAEIVAVGMTGKAVHHNDLRPDRICFVVNANFGARFNKSAAKRFRRLVADDENRIARILDVVFQMMQDSARFAHAACRDDHARIFEMIQRFALFDRADIAN